MIQSVGFQPWLDLWNLTPDGEGFSSLAGRLMPVRHAGAPAMLKLSQSPEELAGGTLMSWWAGEGAARVIAREGEALLLERAMGSGDLADMARSGRDDEACKILCAAGAAIHAPREAVPPGTLVPLELWFRQLWPTADAVGGVMAKAGDVARRLLDQPREICVLHGDLHHGNVLDFGPRGWLVIDPKGLIGDRGYDHANMLCNPDVATALTQGVFGRRVEVVSAASDIAPTCLMSWLLAYCGLSAAWTLADGPGNAEQTLQIADMVAGALGV